VHHGLIHLGAALAEHGLRRAVAPAQRGGLEEGIQAARGWALGKVDLGSVTLQRRACFDRLTAVAEGTWSALSSAANASRRGPTTALDEHASNVVRRYALLSAHYAASSVVLLLDGISEPPLLAQLVEQIAGARAYQGAGLGAARQPEFKTRALDQARWETEELGRETHGENLLALQNFHEYLGVRWKTLYDVERTYIEEFVLWALPPE